MLIPDEEPKGEPAVQTPKEGCAAAATDPLPQREKHAGQKTVKKRTAKRDLSAGIEAKKQAKGELKADKQKRQPSVSGKGFFQKRSRLSKSPRAPLGGRKSTPRKKSRPHRNHQ